MNPWFIWMIGVFFGAIGVAFGAGLYNIIMVPIGARKKTAPAITLVQGLGSQGNVRRDHPSDGLGSSAAAMGISHPIAVVPSPSPGRAATEVPAPVLVLVPAPVLVLVVPAVQRFAVLQTKHCVPGALVHKVAAGARANAEITARFLNNNPTCRTGYTWTTARQCGDEDWCVVDSKVAR